MTHTPRPGEDFDNKINSHHKMLNWGLWLLAVPSHTRAWETE